MKKIILSILAVATLASCAKEETLSYDREAIGFGNAFVDNAVRAIDPSYGKNNLLKEIYVYGTVTGTTDTPVSVFDYTRVWTDAEDGNYTELWNCATTQYWVSGADYKFAAVAGVGKANVTCTNGIPSSINFTSNGTTDLVLSDIVTREDVAATGNKMVAFTMSHLLSKVKFTVTNTTNQGTEHNSGYYYKVSNIKLLNAYTAGTYTVADKVANGTWEATGNTGEVAFGNATNATTDYAAAANIADRDVITSNYERLLVPHNYTDLLQVQFDLALYMNSDDNKINEELGKKVPVDVNLEAGKAYNFALTVSVGQPIQFTVTANPTWTNATSDTEVK